MWEECSACTEIETEGEEEGERDREREDFNRALHRRTLWFGTVVSSLIPGFQALEFVLGSMMALSPAHSLAGHRDPSCVISCEGLE